MPRIESSMLDLGTTAIDFRLSNTEGMERTLSDYVNYQGLLVIFMCNHCPFVKHYFEAFEELEELCVAHGVALVGINPNDTQSYPEDDLAHMQKLKKDLGFKFDYLIDTTQEVAKAYKAMCTPDAYLFDDRRELFYRGQLDASRPSLDLPVDLADIKYALEALYGGVRPFEQKPSLGCSIKWKKGNEPRYFGNL